MGLFEVIFLGIGGFLAALSGVLGVAVLRYMKVEGARARFEYAKSLAQNVVDFLEQAPAYRYTENVNKKEQAFVILGAEFEAAGINIGYDEVDRLIEGAVYGQGDSERPQEDRDEQDRHEG